MVIGLILPHLRTGIVGCASLRLEETSLGHLTHVKVSQFEDALLRQKQVGTLDVPMHDLPVVQGLKAV